MRIFFDTEFTGLQQSTELLSIGLVSEEEDLFYAEFTDYDESLLNPWIQQNVLAKMWHRRVTMKNSPKFRINASETLKYIVDEPEHIKNSLEKWLTSFNEELEIWSDCLAYDWVLFCQLWGGAMNLPKCVYYIPFDICTLFKMKGIDPDISREKFANMEYKDWKHNALWDAKVIKACYEKLMGKKEE